MKKTTKKRTDIWKKTEGHCFYCGTRLSDEHFFKRKRRRDWLLPGSMTCMTLEHKIPKIRGGTNAVENLVLACRACNSSKSKLTVEEFRFKKTLQRRNHPIKFFGEEIEPEKRDILFVFSDNFINPMMSACLESAPRPSQHPH